MLRITKSTNNGTTLLRLEGKLLGPWVEELASQISQENGSMICARLDLSQVSYVDPAGVGLLRDLIRRGVHIDAASSFIAELLHMENP